MTDEEERRRKSKRFQEGGLHSRIPVFPYSRIPVFFVFPVLWILSELIREPFEV
jgi:hypothetical protein